jgi:hypothetical protein
MDRRRSEDRAGQNNTGHSRRDELCALKIAAATVIAVA